VFFSIFVLDLSLKVSPSRSVAMLSKLKKTCMVVMPRGLCPAPTTTRTNSYPAREFCSGSLGVGGGIITQPNERQARGRAAVLRTPFDHHLERRTRSTGVVHFTKLTKRPDGRACLSVCLVQRMYHITVWVLSYPASEASIHLYVDNDDDDPAITVSPRNAGGGRRRIDSDLRGARWLISSSICALTARPPACAAG
jgi:hypothetical protein